MFFIRRDGPLFFLLAASLCGCSASLAVVNGKVTVDGKEVTGGGIVFSPVYADGDPPPGKPGQADIGPDGTFSLNLEPGARGFPHRYTLRYTPPPVRMTKKKSESGDVVIPYQGLVPTQKEVEIKSGVNVVNIELAAAPDR